jgi:hypothetical protein
VEGVIHEQRLQKSVQNFSGILKRLRLFGDLGEYGGIILKLIQKKYVVWILNGWL